MDRAQPLRSNADRLEHALGASREELAAVADEEERSRRADAIDQLSRYVDLLREATARRGVSRYSFKLEFPDGRWDLAERELTAPPRVGDLVWFETGGPWQVLGRQHVFPRPGHKPPHEFFACAPAA